MTFEGLLLFILAVQIIHFAGTWKLYQKAGRQAWEAAIPIYNAVVLMKIINRPWWYTILLFVPIVNLIMFPVVWVETLRSFGRNSNTDTLLGVVTLGFYIYYINYSVDVTHIPDRSLQPRTVAGEWISSILFAVVAATLVHTYFMQPFTIPTSSLEKTLLVGDYLFVSKFHYGARTPMTPISFPMVHDTVPLVNSKSYSPQLKSPYLRMPGFQKIERNDIVVFNWPVDTVNIVSAPNDGRFHYKPIDKKTNYVKRCVGLPGDSLEVRNGYVFVNGEQNVLPERAKLQFGYVVYTKEALTESDIDYIRKRFDITDINPEYRQPNTYYMQITDATLEQFRNFAKVLQVESLRNYEEDGKWSRDIFPYDPRYPNNNVHFGPIYIPKKGATVAITPESIGFYKRIIEVYEGYEMGVNQSIRVTKDEVLLNERPITEYTFLQDYYWMMGDNRNNSEDSRTWGYVPFNHVVGKPVFVWMSIDGQARGLANKFRWERFFTTVGGSGQPVSYFKIFLGLLAAWFVFSFFRKRRKQKA
ncbi:signal peptidase I [Gilvibacter sp.]|uniref:signal peptidase I n=1 Tax=Gilvibacter sp. TaxID=2729997 RepID=UPI003B52F1B8